MSVTLRYGEFNSAVDQASLSFLLFVVAGHFYFDDEWSLCGIRNPLWMVCYETVFGESYTD